MRKNKNLYTEPCGTPAFTNFQLEDSAFKTTLWCVLGRMTQLDQEDYHLFNYCVELYVEDVHGKLSEMPLISLKRHHELIMKD